MDKAFPLVNYGIPILCCIIANALDMDPVETPDAENAALIIIRDSFSCSPRLETVALDMLFVQGHFVLTGCLIFIFIVGVVHTIFVTQGKTSGNESHGFWKNMKKAKVGLLVVMAMIMTLLVFINLFVVLTTAPAMGAFKEDSDAWVTCKADTNNLCIAGGIDGQTCGYTSCRSHDDCLVEVQYCQKPTDLLWGPSTGVCRHCNECYDRKDGVGGECSPHSCKAAVMQHDADGAPNKQMTVQEMCLFNFCPDEIRKW